MGSAQQAHIGHEFNIHKHKKQQTIAATCIQKYTRRFFARKVIKKLRDEEFLKATLRIQVSERAKRASLLEDVHSRDEVCEMVTEGYIHY